jgi:hypothetical protein
MRCDVLAPSLRDYNNLDAGDVTSFPSKFSFFWGDSSPPRLLTKNMEFVRVFDTSIYEVTVFDDGNDQLKSLPNEWRIVAAWRGKVRIENARTGYTVLSISSWKVCATIHDA